MTASANNASARYRRTAKGDYTTALDTATLELIIGWLGGVPELTQGSSLDYRYLVMARHANLVEKLNDTLSGERFDDFNHVVFAPQALIETTLKHTVLGSHNNLGACRRNVIEAKNRVERGQISSISQGNSESIAQESGGIWTAQTVLQPITHFSDRLLGLSTQIADEGRMLAVEFDTMLRGGYFYGAVFIYSLREIFIARKIMFTNGFACYVRQYSPNVFEPL